MIISRNSEKHLFCGNEYVIDETRVTTTLEASQVKKYKL